MKKFKYHLVLGRSLNLENIARDAQANKCPRHVMWQVSQHLGGAAIHRPGKEPIQPIDRVCAQIIGRPEHWALARALSSQLNSEDIVFCTGEDIGIPVATLCGSNRERPKMVVFIHSLDRSRGWMSLQLFPVSNQIDLFVTNTRTQVDFLRRYLRLPATRICLLLEQTDTKFFTPGPVSLGKSRRIIASVGLEYRDYRTLAAVTQDLDVDVKISGFSQDAQTLAKSFPKTLPENMTCRFYEWPELVQLYRDADLVVISLFDNNATAGATTLMEAMSCCRPVIVSQTKGLIDYLETPGAVTSVKPGDPTQLRQAIISLLQNPEKAEAQAQCGYELILNQHNSEQYAQRLATRLKEEAEKGCVQCGSGSGHSFSSGCE
ncbi:MAG: glycosyltransferase family 4 protein [Chroococcidiopsidaceae cyanobacterium CP_BM_ER_R8_30]|nr:glycosyltransferase family 4 protein [Chroococcidiopsidaceae cyanobacterium CP_BM_ER_R8_30]